MNTVCICHTAYTYDGPERPKRGFLENLKITEDYEFRDFWDPAEICQELPEKYETAQQLRKNCAQITISDKFQTSSVISGNFR